MSGILNKCNPIFVLKLEMCFDMSVAVLSHEKMPKTGFLSLIFLNESLSVTKKITTFIVVTNCYLLNNNHTNHWTVTDTKLMGQYI